MCQLGKVVFAVFLVLQATKVLAESQGTCAPGTDTDPKRNTANMVQTKATFSKRGAPPTEDAGMKGAGVMVGAAQPLATAEGAKEEQMERQLNELEPATQTISLNVSEPCTYKDYCMGCICQNLPEGIIRQTSAEAEVIFVDAWIQGVLDTCAQGSVASLFERYPLRTRGKIYFINSNGLYEDPCNGQPGAAAVRTPEDQEFTMPQDDRARDTCTCWQVITRRPDFFFYNIELKMWNVAEDGARSLPGIVIPMLENGMMPAGPQMTDLSSKSKSHGTPITDLLKLKYFIYFWGTPNPGMHGGPASRIHIAEAFQRFYEERDITDVGQLQAVDWTTNGSDKLVTLDTSFAPTSFENRVVMVGTGKFTLGGDKDGSNNALNAQRSLYCLHMRGHTRESARLQLLVAAGCIPVILANGLTLPFSQLIDWEPMVVRLDERKFMDQPAASLVQALREHLREHLPDADSIGKLSQYYRQGLAKVPEGKRLNVLEMRARLVRISDEYFTRPEKVSKSWLRALRAEMKSFHWV